MTSLRRAVTVRKYYRWHGNIRKHDGYAVFVNGEFRIRKNTKAAAEDEANHYKKFYHSERQRARHGKGTRWL